MSAHDLSRARWRKSTRSGGNHDCVEVADLDAATIAVRDSKDPDGPKLIFNPRDWRTLTSMIKNGAYDV
jgi:hypothetical protein